MRIKSILFYSALAFTVSCASKPAINSAAVAKDGDSSYTSNPEAERNPAGESIAGTDGSEWSWSSSRRSHSTRHATRHRAFPSSHRCSAAAAAEWIKKIGQPVHSSHQCLKAVQAAYGGCSAHVIDAIHSYRPPTNGVKSMRQAGWRCESSHNPYSAPEGAVIVEDNHVEIRVGHCFYSDFHTVDCKPGTKYSHRPRRMHGWCMP